MVGINRAIMGSFKDPIGVEIAGIRGPYVTWARAFDHLAISIA